MLSFLFWNLAKRPRLDLLAELVSEHTIDVLVLIENTSSKVELLERLNANTPSKFHITRSLCEKIEILTRFSSEFSQAHFESSRFTIRSISLPGRTTFLLAAAHQPSKLFDGDASQIFGAVELADAIRSVEAEQGHERTVFVGDLNMNPFEPGIVGAKGLHAVSTRARALRLRRTVGGREYPFFYNPMWAMFGEKKEQAPGTYHYAGAEHVTYFWNIFDQVLVRPELLCRFDNFDLRVIVRTRETNLVNDEFIPDVNTGSDHLPVFFRLDI